VILAQQSPIDLSAWLIGTPVTVLAFGIFAFVKGWIIPGPTHNRVLARNDAQTAELRELHAIFFDKVVPALTRATDLMAKITEREMP